MESCSCVVGLASLSCQPSFVYSVPKNGIISNQLLYPLAQDKPLLSGSCVQNMQCRRIMWMERSMTFVAQIYRARRRESIVTSAGMRRGIKHRVAENI